MNERLEMGLYKLRESGSRLGFLRREKTIACLWGMGKEPVSKERLHKRRITGTNRCDSCFKSHVGIWSRDNDLVGQHDKILLTSVSVTGSKEASGVTEDWEKLGGGSKAVESWIVLTLDCISKKYQPTLTSAPMQMTKPHMLLLTSFHRPLLCLSLSIIAVITVFLEDDSQV